MDGKYDEPSELLSGEPSRRRALELIVVGALGALSLEGAVAAPAPGSALPAQEKPQEPGEPMGKLEDLAPGSAKRASYKGRPVLLLNVEGAVRAFLPICTHEGCTVDWNGDLKLLQCPCHDGRFDIDGKVVSGPPPAPLLRFDVTVRDGTIYIVEKKG
ncbi:MAG: Rieske (2Fe-2S) protein [Gemmatimonadetes bacterium]|nr:Rieske (2Fe-2S) protein [Gemmatimonadota bacterium]